MLKISLPSLDMKIFITIKGCRSDSILAEELLCSYQDYVSADTVRSMLV